MTTPLGKATVEIDGDTSKLNKSVSEAKRETNKLGESGLQAGQKMGQGFDNAGKKLSRLQEGFSKLVIPLSLFAGFAKLIDFIGRSRHELDEFDRKLGQISASSVSRLNDAQRTAAGISDSERAVLEAQESARQEIDTITRDLEQRLLSISQRFKDNSLVYEYVIGGATSEELTRVAEQRIAQINENTRQLAARIRRQARQDAERENREQSKAEAKEREKIAKESAGRIFSEIESLKVDLLPEEQQIRAKTQLAINALRDELEEAGIINERDVEIALDLYEQYLRKKQDRDIAEHNDRIERESRAEIEKAERVAKAAGDAMQRELQRAFDSVNASFGFNFTDAADAIAAAINRSASRRGRQ